MVQFLTGLLVLVFVQCGSIESPPKVAAENPTIQEIVVGAEDIDSYLPLLQGKSVAGVFNQSSMLSSGHMADVLLQEEIDLKFVFALEHGFRGNADAGAKIKDGVDLKSGLSLISLYGKKKKPTSEDLAGIDVLIFDIQDVGVRFYTYISTLHYIMEACAENGVKIIVLDRPNPNGHYIDGPLLEDEYKSFVGMHNIPVVYGMTIGEYAMMIKGEKWINKAAKCDLTVIKCQNYNHSNPYDLPIKPSPNLPNYKSILLYPSLCFFEGTSVSIGRGTDKQFQIIGHPGLGDLAFNFTPKPMLGAKDPKHNGVTCFGKDLSNEEISVLHAHRKLNLEYLIDYHSLVRQKEEDFFTRPDFFDKLAGTNKLRSNIEAGKSSAEIRASWQEGLQQFKKTRSKYLIYPE